MGQVPSEPGKGLLMDKFLPESLSIREVTRDAYDDICFRYHIGPEDLARLLAADPENLYITIRPGILDRLRFVAAMKSHGFRASRRSRYSSYWVFQRYTLLVDY